jgi:hypothetical protein
VPNGSFYFRYSFLVQLSTCMRMSPRENGFTRFPRVCLPTSYVSSTVLTVHVLWSNHVDTILPVLTNGQGHAPATICWHSQPSRCAADRAAGVARGSNSRVPHFQSKANRAMFFGHHTIISLEREDTPTRITSYRAESLCMCGVCLESRIIESHPRL